MTKSKSSSGTTRSKKRTADQVVKTVFRRKVCLFCFMASLIVFALVLGLAITLTVITVNNWKEIGVLLNKQSALKSRSDIEAFYEIDCPIYSDNSKLPDKWDQFDLAFCNRYCDRNQMFEFMYRQLDPNRKSSAKSKDNQELMCPIYVEFKQCQMEEGGHCEEKLFSEEFTEFVQQGGGGDTSSKEGNETIGTCVPCPS
ncbi:hypothetical protein niasHS_003284 [Heterodera schachtii]|uniref:Uncharacterized protein n=1 Tax=Heterodera schachtii TaxID=97005 RepID=A0ABD2KGT7_HETSC